MKKILAIMVGLATLSGTSAFAAPIVYTVAQLQALTQAGLVTDAHDVTFASLISSSASSTAGVGRHLNDASDVYDFVNPEPLTRAQAVGAANGRWIQTSSEEIFDLGSRFSEVYVSNPFDHDRFSANLPTRFLESLEYTVWGSNAISALGAVDPSTSDFSGNGWELGKIDRIYADGYNAAAVWDDWGAVLNFDSGNSYQYLHVIASSTISIDGFTSADNEIEFVAGIAVPAPATVALLLAGLLGLGLTRRRNAD